MLMHNQTELESLFLGSYAALDNSVGLSWLPCKMITILVLPSWGHDGDQLKITHLKYIAQCLARSEPSVTVPCHDDYRWEATPFTIIFCPSPPI